MSEPDADRPAEGSHADVTLVTRGITMTARVEVSGPTLLVLRPAGGPGAAPPPVAPGDAVEVYWVGGYAERTLPATVSDVESGPEPRWQLLATGPAESSQRRSAVRARVELPVLMPWAGAHMTGMTVDLSEAGMRAQLDAWGLPPEAGMPAQCTLTLDDEVLLDLHGEIVRQQARGALWLLSMRFDRVTEAAADALRRRVFRALREERARTDD
jgi:PilZ domain